VGKGEKKRKSQREVFGGYRKSEILRVGGFRNNWQIADVEKGRGGLSRGDDLT